MDDSLPDKAWSSCIEKELFSIKTIDFSVKSVS